MSMCCTYQLTFGADCVKFTEVWPKLTCA